MPSHFQIAHGVPLAPLTTLGLGGRARHFVSIENDAAVASALRWAAAHELPTFVLGGGSNVVIGDDGIDALVIHIGTRGVQMRREAARVVVRAAAGEPWDAVVEAAVHANLAGIECLSGIPGRVGATPIQNVGAYGQEVADVITRVCVMDRSSLEVRELAPQACEFGYRDSVFKRERERYLVQWVEFTLRPGGPPTLRYPEVAASIATPRPSLADVRAAVIALRRSKSMVVAPDDPNRRSVGSFFTNPVVEHAQADNVVALALARGVAQDAQAIPRFAGGSNRVKLSAAWLIERSGFKRGVRRGAVGISSRHALALVHHGGGTSGELLAFAREIRDAVCERWGVELTPEPVLVGEYW